MKKIRNFWNFCHFRGHCSVILGCSGSTKNIQKSLQRHVALYSMGDNFYLFYKFGTCKCLYKKNREILIFFSPYGTWAENKGKQHSLHKIVKN